MTGPTLPAEPTPYRFAIQGQLYETIDGAVTFRRSHAVHALLAKAGVEATGLEKGVSVADTLLKTTAQLYEAGVLFDLLAALVTPVGRPWTAEVATAMAEQFAETTDVVEQQLLSAILFQALLAFFTTRGAVGPTSAPSSTEAAPPSESLSSAAPSAAPRATADSLTTDPGTPSSVSSLSTTPIGSP